MNAITAHHPTRRAVLRAGLAAGGGLLLSLRLRPAHAAATTPPATDFSPDAFIRIRPDGGIAFIMRNTEVGQGIYTSVAMLLAEELEVSLGQISVEAAPADNALYADPSLGEQATGGSASIRGSWKQMREAGATARTMLVAAAAGLWSVDPATCTAAGGIVSHPPSGRSLAYGALAERAATLPVPKDVPLKSPDRFTLIGTSPRRLDTPAKVNGAAKFGIDVQVPGMRFGAVQASPVLGGHLVSLDEAAARTISGVVDIIRLDDVVAVTATSTWAAQRGLEAAAPHWDDGPHGGVGQADIVAALERATTQPGVVAADRGDAAAAIAASTKRLDATYQLPFLAHAPMEPINTTLHIRPDGADVWVGTQVPPRAQATVAAVTGLPPASITIHNQYMGGAFGRRLDIDSITQAARLAKAVSYPVKFTWSREEDIRHDLPRPYYYDRVAAGLDAQGRITGFSHHIAGSSVMARWAPPGMTKNGTLDPDAVEGAVETPYDFAHHRVEWVRVEPPGVTTLWWRGVGPTHNVFVVESAVDELAALAGRDPVDFRRDMLGHQPRARRVLDAVAKSAGWGSELPKGSGHGVCLQFAFDTWIAAIVRVTVGAGGEITLDHAHVAVDCGPVVSPDGVRAQVQGGMIFGLTMAMYSELTLAGGRVQQSNFHDYRMLRMADAPLVEVELIDSPDAPIGGIGETGTVAAAPALANAIFAATGRRLRKIPFATGALLAS